MILHKLVVYVMADFSEQETANKVTIIPYSVVFTIRHMVQPYMERQMHPTQALI